MTSRDNFFKVHSRHLKQYDETIKNIEDIF